MGENLDNDWIEFRSRLNILEIVSGYVPLKKRGSGYFGLCPFHTEKTPSFSVSPSRQIFKCFGCGKGGDVLTFTREIEWLSYPEALYFLAKKYNIPLPKKSRDAYQRRETLLELLEAATRYYEGLFWYDSRAKAARDYMLNKRRFTRETLKEFRIGYAHDDPKNWEGMISFIKKNGFTAQQAVDAGIAHQGKTNPFDLLRGRIIFPIFDRHNHVISFAGRTDPEINDSIKYLNGRESPLYNKGKILYGLNYASDWCKEKNIAIIVEGYTDVMMASQYRLYNVVALCGTDMTEAQALLLRRFCNRTIVALDPDAAGERATRRSVGELLRCGFITKATALPGKDLDEVLLKEGESYKEKIEKDAVPLYEFELNRIIKHMRGKDIKTCSVDERLNLLIGIIPFLDMLNSPIHAISYLHHTAKLLDVPYAATKKAMLKSNNKNYFDDIVGKQPISPFASEQTEFNAIVVMLRKSEYMGKFKEELTKEHFTNQTTRAVFQYLSDLDHRVSLFGEQVLSVEQSLFDSEYLRPEDILNYCKAQGIGVDEARLYAMINKIMHTSAINLEPSDLIRRLNEHKLERDLKGLEEEVYAADAGRDPQKTLAVLKEYADLYGKYASLRPTALSKKQPS